MIDAIGHYAGWLAIAGFWAFLPVACYATWRQFRHQLKARRPVLRFERLSPSLPHALPVTTR